MAILQATSSQNNRGGNGRYVPLRKRTKQEESKHFDNFDNLKDVLDGMDRRNLMVNFKQTKDPINLVFDHIDSKPLSKLAKDFVKDTFFDIANFIVSVIE